MNDDTAHQFAMQLMQLEGKVNRLEFDIPSEASKRLTDLEQRVEYLEHLQATDPPTGSPRFTMTTAQQGYLVRMDTFTGDTYWMSMSELTGANWHRVNEP